MLGKKKQNSQEPFNILLKPKNKFRIISLFNKTNQIPLQTQNLTCFTEDKTNPEDQVIITLSKT